MYSLHSICCTTSSPHVTYRDHQINKVFLLKNRRGSQQDYLLNLKCFFFLSSFLRIHFFTTCFWSFCSVFLCTSQVTKFQNNFTIIERERDFCTSQQHLARQRLFLRGRHRHLLRKYFMRSYLDTAAGSQWMGAHRCSAEQKQLFQTCFAEEKKRKKGHRGTKRSLCSFKWAALTRSFPFRARLPLLTSQTRGSSVG